MAGRDDSNQIGLARQSDGSGKTADDGGDASLNAKGVEGSVDFFSTKPAAQDEDMAGRSKAGRTHLTDGQRMHLAQDCHPAIFEQQRCTHFWGSSRVDDPCFQINLALMKGCAVLVLLCQDGTSITNVALPKISRAFASLSGMAQAMGLWRWVFVVHDLARAHQAGTAEAKAAAEAQDIWIFLDIIATPGT